MDRKFVKMAVFAYGESEDVPCKIIHVPFEYGSAEIVHYMRDCRVDGEFIECLGVESGYLLHDDIQWFFEACWQGIEFEWEQTYESFSCHRGHCGGYIIKGLY